MVSSLLWGLLIYGLYRGIRAVTGLLPANNGGVMTVAAMLFLLSVVVGVFSWVLPLLSRFTFSIGNLNRMAVKLALGHIFRTVLLGLLTVAAVALCTRTWYPIMVVPELLAVLWAAIMEPVFKQYMTEEEREAVERPPEDREDPL